MSKLNISIEQLFELGAHFGHRKRFWNPHMEDYIFCEKNNIHIIDLYKTQEKIVELYETFKALSSVGNKVMVVGTKRVASSYVEEFGQKTGMPYISHRWLGGMLTNWKTIKVPINKLLEYEENKSSGQLESMIKKEAVMLEKEMKKLSLVFDGVKDMKGLPDAIFVIDVENEKIASIMSRSYQGLKKKDLTDTEFLQFWLFSMLGYRRVENIYLQYKNGFLTEEAFDRIGMSFYRTPIQLETVSYTHLTLPTILLV